MRDNVHRLADDGEQLRQECQDAIIAFGLSQNQAAREIGISATRLSQWLAGKYPGDNIVLDGKIRNWLNTRRKAERLSLAASGIDTHCDLGITDEISTALAHAHAVGDVVLIHGQSGAGKSWAGRHYCRTESNAHYISMTRAVRSLSGLLGRIGLAIGIRDRHGSALDAETAIIERLTGSGALLVVDEAHHLTPRLLDELRCIRDIAGCGLALMGDDSVLMPLARCPQIVGRIGFTVDAHRPSDADVLDIATGVIGALHERDRTICIAAAGGPGGLHRLRRLLARAWLLAAAEGREMIESEDLSASSAEEIAA